MRSNCLQKLRDIFGRIPLIQNKMDWRNEVKKVKHEEMHYRVKGRSTRQLV
jgi:hypothetical protein